MDNGNQGLRNGKRAIWVSLQNATARAAPNYNSLPSTTTFAGAMIRTLIYPHRQSNNYCPNFTDQELMTIYLFGLIEQRFTLSQTYKYICNHWLDWFPQLPSYQAVRL